MKHYLHANLVSPSRPVSLALIGCGGTGSQILTGLARLHKALVALGHRGLNVRVWDNDLVSEANVGRQLFSSADIGLNKATVLVTRVNQFMGLDWSAMPFRYLTEDMKRGQYKTDLLVTAVDGVKTRLSIPKYAPARYWLDTGNTKNSGQVVFGAFKNVAQPHKVKDCVKKLPVITDLYDLSTVNEEDSGPSCSLAAALEQQELYVNQMVATCALQILWQGFRYGYLEQHGCFINLSSMKVTPLPVDPKTWARMQG